jgi:hypothetical protein
MRQSSIVAVIAFLSKKNAGYEEASVPFDWHWYVQQLLKTAFAFIPGVHVTKGVY